MPLILIVVVVVFVFSVRGCGGAEDDTSRSDVSRYYEIKALVEGSVRDALRDPESAEFRGFFPGEAEGNVMGCGEVNARNALGGYTGFKRYVSAGGDFVALEGESTEFAAVWSAFCEPFKHRRP